MCGSLAVALFLAAWPSRGLSAGAAKPSAGGGASDTPGAHTWELGLSGFSELDTSAGANVSYFDVRLGYFVANAIEIGVTTLMGTTPEGQRDTFGAFGEYDFVTGSHFEPFLGLSLEHAAPPLGGDGRDARVLTLDGGINTMVAPHVAVNTTFSWEFASHAVLGTTADRRDRERSLRLGLRLFL